MVKSPWQLAHWVPSLFLAVIAHFRSQAPLSVWQVASEPVGPQVLGFVARLKPTVAAKSASEDESVPLRCAVEGVAAG